MANLSFDEAKSNEYWVKVEVGNIYSDDGQTWMQLDGDGNIQAELLKKQNTKDQTDYEPILFTGILTEHKVNDLLGKASHLQWDSQFPQREGIPDEAIVIWSFGRKDEQHITTKMWLKDAEKDPGVSPLLMALRRELCLLSKDSIFL